MAVGPALTPRLGVQAGWALSSTVTRFAPVVILVYAYQHGGAGLVAVTSVGLSLLGTVAATLVGAYGDRVHLAHVLHALVGVGAVALALSAVVASTSGPALIVLGTATLSCAVLSTYRPVQAAILPWLVHSPRELATANVASSAIESAASLVGPAAAGAALLVLSADRALFIGAACAGLALVPTSRIALPVAYRPERAGGRSMRSYAAGLAALWRLVPRGGVSVLVVAQAFARGALSVLLVILVLDLFRLGDDAVGWMWSALGLGGITGAAVGTVLLRVSRLGRAFVLGVLLWGVGLLLLGMGTSAWVAGAAMVVVGLGNAVEDAGAFTLVARLAPRGSAARALSAIEILAFTAGAFGAASAPALARAVDVRRATLVIGVVIVALCAIYAAGFVRVDATSVQTGGAPELLTSVSIFEPLPMVVVEHLAGCLERHDYDSGQAVMREGDPGTDYHVIASGSASVSVRGVDRPALLPGDGFGEIALLRHSSRTATVTAAEPLTTYSLARDDFLTALQGSSASAEALAESRLSGDPSS